MDKGGKKKGRGAPAQRGASRMSHTYVYSLATESLHLNWYRTHFPSR